MSDNPYQSPALEAQVIGVLSGRPEDLRAVAMYQRGIIACILIYFIAMIGQVAVPLELRWIVGVGILLAGLIGMICVFLLAIRVYSLALGLLFGLLTFVPCVGLLMLLMI